LSGGLVRIFLENCAHTNTRWHAVQKSPFSGTASNATGTGSRESDGSDRAEKHQMFHGRVDGVESPTRRATILSDLDDITVHNIMQTGELFKRKLRVGDMLVDKNRCQSLVTHPNSRSRLAWDLTGFAFIIYDVIVIPLFVFNLPEGVTFTMALTWVSTCWWTADIFVSFVTGFHIDGFLEMRPRMIAKRYFRTWFVPDLTIVLIDWTFVILNLGDAAGILRIRRTARALRIIRALRLVRLIKVTEILAKLADGVNSEFILILMSIAKLVISVVILNHYIACAWYALSESSDDDECSWIRRYDVVSVTNGYKYFTSLHWSMTQFMPASMEVNPCNEKERAFTIGVLVFGLVTFSSFVSRITTVMTQLANISKDRTLAELNLRQYLNENRVSVDLGMRIRRYFRESYEARRKRVHEPDISFFGSLPEHLKMELRREIYMPVLTLHPLLCRYACVDATGMWLVCHLAMSQQSWLPGQTIFLRGELASEMLFVLSGELDYFVRRASCTRVEMDQWLCEGALWSKKWNYCGRLVAMTTCELYGVCSAKFRAVTGERSGSFRYLRSYASHFLARVREAQEKGGYVTDICEDFEALDNIVQCVFEDLETNGNNGLRSESGISSGRSFAARTSSSLMSGIERSTSSAAIHMTEKRLPQRVIAKEVEKDDNMSVRSL